jgi:hypothetical protein
MLNLPTIDPRSEFCQAESLAARIVVMLRPEDCSGTERQLLEQYPFPCDRIRNVLVRIPGCRDIWESICAAEAKQLEPLEHRLSDALKSAESTQPKDVEELECLLFRTSDFEQVWAEELDDVEKLRNLRKAPGDLSAHFIGATASKKAHDAELCGLCFSGGGVRSATFSLGILQGMAKYGVLRRVDYLSTVSGGGYIGGWLAAWIKRNGFETVEKALRCEDLNPRRNKMEPIAFLRDYSSYLTPNKGVFTADTWTGATTWVRNTLLNLIVLLSLLAALLLLPHLPVAFLGFVTLELQHFGHGWEELITLVAVIFQAIVISTVIRNLKLFKTSRARRDLPRAAQSSGEPNPNSGFGDPLADVQIFILAPALVSAWLCGSRLWAISREPSVNVFHLGGIVLMVLVCFILLVTLQVQGGYIECYMRERKSRTLNKLVARGLCGLLPLITTGVKVSILWGVYTLFRNWASSPGGLSDAHAAVWGMPLILGDYALCIAIHIGLMGRYLPDDRREWWSRVAAYLGIYAVAICSLSMACYYAPSITRISFPSAWRWSAVVLLWAVITYLGVIAATSRRGARPARSFLIPIVTGTAPYVFMVGLFLSVSLAIHQALAACEAALAAHGWQYPRAGLEVIFFIVATVIGGLMAWTVDVNEFSMHHFYRNRLIRTYLGASNRRKPNRLTGFDACDDLLLASLRPEREPGLQDSLPPYTGPYPIFNAALNLVHGDRLSRQERKATSFIFSPRFCGYNYTPDEGAKSKPPLCNAGYRPTAAYAYPDGGVHLGTAMAISGAATSPNAGRYTSTPMAFLLTVFNVRLGWWMGNPRHDKSWRRSGPTFGLMYLVRELFGTATDRQSHVYLSDGGHFENLGIYELVRRGCSLIIACDAEEDPAFSFTGLGDAIRKCFIDFGVRIKIDLNKLRPGTDKLTKSHAVTGDIHYQDGSMGRLIYIKTSMTGDEPADLCAYRAQHDCFPHQSTAEQFFEESQFESYHRLGLHIGKEVFKDWNPKQCEWQGVEALASAQTA